MTTNKNARVLAEVNNELRKITTNALYHTDLLAILDTKLAKLQAEREKRQKMLTDANNKRNELMNKLSTIENDKKVPSIIELFVKDCVRNDTDAELITATKAYKMFCLWFSHNLKYEIQLFNLKKLKYDEFLQQMPYECVTQENKCCFQNIKIFCTVEEAEDWDKETAKAST